MKKIISTILGGLIFSIFPFILFGQETKPYILDKKIEIPGNGGYDYLSIDKINNHLYVSHGTAVNVIDLSTEKVIGTIDGMLGVHGIAFANKYNKGFISDGKGNAVIAFDLTTFKKLATIPLTDKDADAILYDSFSDKVFTFNGDSHTSSVVDPVELKQVTSIDLGGAPEFAVSDGEGKIYNNLEDKSSLNIIDTKTLKVIQNFPLAPCVGPTGLAIDKNNHRLFTVCRGNKGVTVVNSLTGEVITTLPIGAGVDAVVYDSEANLIFCSCGDATTTIIKQLSADKYVVVQTLTTQNRAKTMALDTKTHKIYLSAPEFEPGTKKIVPNTFKVLVFKQ